jgi:hypothetical protein
MVRKRDTAGILGTGRDKVVGCAGRSYCSKGDR